MLPQFLQSTTNMSYYQAMLQGSSFSIKTVVILGVAALTLSLRFGGFLGQKSKARKEIPSPKGAHFLLGHLPLLKKNPGVSIFKWHQELGPIFKIKAGTQTWVFLGDRETAHEILEVQAAFSSGKLSTPLLDILSPKNTGVLFTDYSKKVNLSRKAILQTLSHDSIEGMSDGIERETQKAVNHMRDCLKEGNDFHVEDYVFMAVANVLMFVVYGVSPIQSTSDPECRRHLYYLHGCLKFGNVVNDYTYLFPSLAFLNVLSGKSRRIKRLVDKFYNDCIKKYIRLAQEHQRPCMVNGFYAAKNQLTEQEILSLTAEIVLAGEDTLMSSNLWALAILANYPKVQKRICDELDDFIRKNGRQPTYKEKEMLPYFVAFHKECFRFRPPGNLNVPRKATQDVAYKDYIIPKDVILFASSDPFGRDTSVHENADEFLPERFFKDSRTLLASGMGNIKSRTDYTFGWGRRRCLGSNFSDSQFFYFTTRILATSTIEPLNSSMGEKIDISFENAVSNDFTKKPAPYSIKLVDRPDRLVN